MISASMSIVWDDSEESSDITQSTMFWWVKWTIENLHPCAPFGRSTGSHSVTKWANREDVMKMTSPGWKGNLTLSTGTTNSPPANKPKQAIAAMEAMK